MSPAAKPISIQTWLDFKKYITGDPKVLAQIEAAVEARANGMVDEVADAIYRRMATAISGALSPVAYRKALNVARDEARIQARTLATHMTEAELNKIGKVVAEGLQEGKGPREIARRLDFVQGLDSNRTAQLRKFEEGLKGSGLSEERQAKLLERERGRLLRERRVSIAQTEARYATSAARRSEAEATEAGWHGWMTSRDSRVSKDICARNEAAGIIPIDQAFPSGHKDTPGHVKCRCTKVYYSSPDVAKRANVRQLERSKQTAEALGVPQEDLTA